MKLRIKTRYYHHQSKSGYGEGGHIVLENRKICSLEGEGLDQSRPFYYNQTHLTISCERGDKMSKVDINRILTESAYAKDQREYLIHLNWLQQQKLRWMFKKHWFQTPEFKRQLFKVIFLLVGLAALYYLWSHVD